MQEPSKMLLLLLPLLVLVTGCSGDALRQCEEKMSEVEEQNQVLQEALSQSQVEYQQLQLTLVAAEAEAEGLRQDASQPEPDFSSMREGLWLLFHDQKPSVWACDETASQVVPVDEMPSASPEGMVSAINARFQTLNPALESPDLVLEGMDGDTAVVSLRKANVVTEQMGSTGAQCYFAGVTFSLTSFEGIDHVRFDIEEGNHGGPGRYDRADFVHFLPLELYQP